MNTQRQQENPYLTATIAPRPTAPFNGIGVLADTQASITHAQNAIETFGYNLDAERDRQQARVVKDTNFPYAVEQTKFTGEGNVRRAQGYSAQAGAGALAYGVPIDQFSPLAGRTGITEVDGKTLYAGVEAPTSDNPTMSQGQYKEFADRWQDAPAVVGADVDAQGQLAPLTDPNAPAAATAGGLPPFLADPYNMQGLNIPGTPSSVVGITRGRQLRPGVAPSARDAAVRNVESISADIQRYQRELEEGRATLGGDPNWFTRAGADNRVSTAVANLERLTPKLKAATAFLNGLTETPGPVGPPLVGGADNNYGIPTARQPGSDPLPEAPANAATFAVPLAMARQRPDLVPGFQNAVSLYTTHAPGGPGGVEAALVTAALESDFAPAAKAKTSSATGMTQFTEKTWMNVAKTLPWAKGKSDDELMALRSSPAHQAQAERQLRALNYAAATAKFPGQFDPANPLNLYAMHHFGEDTGGKIAAALRKSPNALLPTIIGAKAWAAAVAANPYLVQRGIPMTPAQLYANWIGRAQKRGFYGGVRA